MRPTTILDRSRALWLLLFALGLIVVCTPRFNRQDLLIDAYTTGGAPAREVLGDAAQYVALTQHFRGTPPVVALTPPFAYRPLVPGLAALLPTDAMTAINIVNLAAMMLAVLLLLAILARLGLSPGRQFLGCWLYIVSFPVFFYGPIGLVDPVQQACLMAATWCVLSGAWFRLLLALALGGLVKETIVVFLPALCVFLLFSPLTWARRIAIAAGAGLVALASILLARATSPVAADFMWQASTSRTLANITSPRAILSFGLGLGLPGVGAAALLPSAFRELPTERPLFAFLLVGFGTALALSVYAALAGYADGRFIWTAYPFTIPLALLLAPGGLSRAASASSAEGPSSAPDRAAGPGAAPR